MLCLDGRPVRSLPHCAGFAGRTILSFANQVRGEEQRMDSTENVDLDNDGVAESAVMDNNGDGRVDAVETDVDGDGLGDLLVEDADFDGYADSIISAYDQSVSAADGSPSL